MAIQGAPPQRRTRRSQEEIMDLLLSAAADEFKRFGYSGATTAAIARAAGVTEAQLFRYFPSKADLFRAAIFKPLDRHFVDFQSRQFTTADASQDHRAKARSYITELQQFIGDFSPMLMSLIVAQAYASHSVQGVGAIDGLEDYFERGAAMMSSRMDAEPRVDPRLMVRVSFGAVLANVMFKDWLFPEGLATDEEISAAIIDFVIDGIRANSDPGLDALAKQREDI